MMEISISTKNLTTKNRLISALLLLQLFLCIAYSFSQDRPNIILLRWEDASPHLGSYGVTDAKTPNLDVFAQEGVRYINAFVTTPVCTPTKESMATGVWPVTQGSHHHRNSESIPKSLVKYKSMLATAGYDVKPASFKRTDPSKPYYYHKHFQATHEAANSGGPGIYNVDTMTSYPPYYPDTEKAKNSWGKYLTNVNKGDQWFGDRLAELKASGELENSIVMFMTDHGVGLPRAKRFCYDSGLRVPWIIRVPDKWKHLIAYTPGTVTDEIIGTIDYAPTLLTIAGVAIPSHMQGRPFLGETSLPHSQYMYGHRDRMDERVDIVRTVRDKKMRYMRHYEYFKLNMTYVKYGEDKNHTDIMREIRRITSEPNPPANLSWYFEFKGYELLFDIEKDPHEMVNVAKDPAYYNKLLELRAENIKLRTKYRDLGVVPEGMIVEGRLNHGSEYEYGKAIADTLVRAWEVMDSLPLYSSSQLISLLKNSHDIIKYWAAIGLGNIGENTVAVKQALEGALGTNHILVKVAAARSLLMYEENQNALETFKEGLLHPTPEIRLTTIDYADIAGSRVASIRTELAATEIWSPHNFIDDIKVRLEATITDPVLIPDVLKPGCLDPTNTSFDPSADVNSPAHCNGLLSGDRQTKNYLKFSSFNEIYTLQLPQQGNYTIRIYSFSGKLLENMTVKNRDKITFESGQFNTGSYLVNDLTWYFRT